ncbi:MAG: hypothetical protein AAGA62_15350, partial [Bacteroidota bacterium]
TTDITLADFTNDLALASTNIFVGSAGGVATAVNPNGDVEIANDGTTTIQADSVALGTDTTGNYVQSLADAGAGDLTITNGATEGGAATIDITDDSLDFTELADALTLDATTSFDLDTNAADLNFDSNTLLIDSSANSVLVGAGAETIDNAGFVMDAGDLFVADTLGVEGAIYTDATATKYQFIDIFGCIRGSASSGTVAGGASPVVRFDAGGNSQMRCSFPVPDDWVSGTDIDMEIFFSPSDNTAGDVDFELFHAAFGIGETVAGGSFTDTVAGPSTVNINTELDLYELNEDLPAAGLAADDMVNIRFRRTPGTAADTYAGDVNIHMLRIAYTGKRLE